MSIDVNAVSRIDSEAGLFDFLRSELGWPLADSPETYDFYADEMGLNGGDSGRIGRVRQIVNFQTGQPWGVFLVEHIGGLSRKALRAVLRGLSETRRDRDAALPAWKAGHLLFLCTPDYREVSFAHFRGETHTRATLSIFGWERDKTGLRTLCDYNLPALRYPEDPSDTGGWLEGWASAFDVEKVTQRFYEAYERIFHQAEERIGGVRGDRRLFTQRLFNRLMFIHFLSKKGWLRFDGRTDYLNALWEGRDPEENFYRYHLLPLFFCGLNNVQARDLTLNSPTLAALIGEVPYLNGGLFEKTESDEAGESVPDEIFPCVFQELFFRFNFTVHESTSQDIEVAVDPEMLGKVFEELVTQGERHSTGSYYTPRPVVEFMCREALKGYLGGCEDLVGGRDAESVTVPQARQLLAKLKAVKVVDPACGSGAYLLGMLHELHALARLLDTRAQEASARDDYKRKLDIIQGNLYGVDKEEFAVNIARLRLWLSLAVEYEGDDPQPLPNLDFKIERQDSLLAPDPRGGLQPDMFRQQQIEEFESLKARYADPYCAGDKPDLKKRIGEQKAAIARWLNPGPREGGFDWRVEFSEVFQGGGFDIALANPPYVRQELIKELKPALKALYPAVYTGTADLYCYFYARALQLLKPGGMLAFISSNKWFRASYGEKLRRLMAESCLIHSITDFGDLPVFQSATAYPMIFIAEKADRDELTGSPSPDAGQTRRSAPTETPTLFTQVKSLAPPYPDVLAVVRQEGLRLPPDAFDGADWTLADSASADRLRKMEKAG
ncbi:MAG: Eco57I restriction-modification methylase domain-containing protein, partial [Armatimonadetes bacterium]|nr:Eco57I restriction-modification methylase domain-containing protein [Armatimonadota bacterium]